MSRKKSSVGIENLKKTGERIRQLRESLGLNQSQFANLLGISGNFVSDLELAKAPPTKPILLLIESRWSILPDQILTGEGFDSEKVKRYVSEQSHTEGLSEPLGPYPQPTEHEYELISALRELDPISRKGVYLSAITQLNEAMKEKNIRKDKRKKEILEKAARALTKAVAET